MTSHHSTFEGFGFISATDLAEAWGDEFSSWFLSRIANLDFRYRTLSQAERDEVIVKVLAALDTTPIQAGEHRIQAWESGWGENRQEFSNSGSAESLIPGYFGKYPVVRWRQEWVKPFDASMEYQMLGILLDWIFDSKIPDNTPIYEFGCGTGHNLLRARERHPGSVLWGLDWARESQNIINNYAELHDPNLFSRNFDYFNPDHELEILNNATVITVASLEQTGDRFKTFIDYLATQPIAQVIHVEPVAELLDPGSLPDNLSIRYFRYRNYLNGLLAYLTELEGQGRVQILEAKRTYLGSLFIDGYSLIRWTPKVVSE